MRLYSFGTQGDWDMFVICIAAEATHDSYVCLLLAKPPSPVSLEDHWDLPRMFHLSLVADQSNLNMFFFGQTPPPLLLFSPNPAQGNLGQRSGSCCCLGLAGGAPYECPQIAWECDTYVYIHTTMWYLCVHGYYAYFYYACAFGWGGLLMNFANCANTRYVWVFVYYNAIFICKCVFVLYSWVWLRGAPYESPQIVCTRDVYVYLYTIMWYLCVNVYCAYLYYTRGSGWGGLHMNVTDCLNTWCICVYKYCNMITMCIYIL